MISNIFRLFAHVAKPFVVAEDAGSGSTLSPSLFGFLCALSAFPFVSPSLCLSLSLPATRPWSIADFNDTYVCVSLPMKILAMLRDLWSRHKSCGPLVKPSPSIAREMSPFTSRLRNEMRKKNTIQLIFMRFLCVNIV